MIFRWATKHWGYAQGWRGISIDAVNYKCFRERARPSHFAISATAKKLYYRTVPSTCHPIILACKHNSFRLSFFPQAVLEISHVVLFPLLRDARVAFSSWSEASEPAEEFLKFRYFVSRKLFYWGCKHPPPTWCECVRVCIRVSEILLEGTSSQRSFVIFAVPLSVFAKRLLEFITSIKSKRALPGNILFSLGK